MQEASNKKALIILNPKAGTGTLSRLVSELDNFSEYFDHVTLTGLDDLGGYVRSVFHKYDVFIAAGGDGTVNSLASILVNSGKILAALPYGSGNGFAREMGFTRDLKKLVDDISRGDYIETDVLMINDKYCVNVAGTGIDSFVAHSFHDLEKRGFGNYIITTFKTVSNIKPVDVEIKGDDIETGGKFYLVSVANNRQFGNNAIVAPFSQPDDGFFELVLLRPFPKAMMGLFAMQLMTGTLKESKYLKYIKTKGSISIRSGDSRFQIDGEPVSISEPVRIDICRKALRVLKTSSYISKRKRIKRNEEK
ncbi:MAG: diacylglycerol kinase family protein [Bacteroidales bacterium]